MLLKSDNANVLCRRRTQKKTPVVRAHL